MNEKDIRNDFSGDDFEADTYIKTDIPEKQTSETDSITRVVRTGAETEVRQVDPTQNKKLQKRKQEAKNRVVKKQFKLPKWALALIAIVLVGAIAIIAKTIISANSSGGNFFTVFDTVLQPTQQGVFHYEITVATQPYTQENTETNTVVEVEESEVIEELNSIENNEDLNISEFANEKVGSNYMFKEWTNIDGTKVTSWQYPTFRIIVDEICTNSNPFEANFKISLATPVANSEFTEIVVKDGKYYVDLDTMRNWLLTSSDSYLMSLAKDIPEGIKFIEITENEFAMYSRYAESYEQVNSFASLQTKLNRGLTLWNMLESSFKSVIPNTAYQTTQDSYKISIGTETGSKIINNWVNFVLNASNTYNQYLTSLQSSNFVNETQYQQYLNEKDNVLKALNDLQIYFNTTDMSLCDMTALGTARQYNNAQGNMVAETNFDVLIHTPEKQYTVNCVMTRAGVQGGSVSVNVPNATITPKNTLNEAYSDVLYNTINSVVDYFNPTCIDLGEQLEPNPDKIIDTIRQSLVDIVNSTEETGIYLTTLTVDDYIEKYSQMDYDTALTQDRINILIVQDFLETVNSVTGEVYIEVPVEAEEEVLQYPELVYENSEIKIIGQFNVEESNANLYVVDTLIMNKKDTPISIDLTNFSVRTLLSSKYTANSFTELHSYDNTWDDILSPTTLDLNQSSYANVKLYFVVNGDSGYMDMWFGEENLGVVVSN